MRRSSPNGRPSTRTTVGAGELEFHDLLVLCRSLLRDPENGPHVRRQLAERYQRLLIDEFQDTDPIQIEIATLLTASDPDADGRDWRNTDVARGPLVLRR